MKLCHLRITVDDVTEFDAYSSATDPADACYHAQQQVDTYSWANPGKRVVGELTAPHGERHLIRPTEVTS